MAELLVVLFVALEIAAAAVHLRGKLALGGWLLTGAGVTMCAGIVAELLRGKARLGLGAYPAFESELGFYLMALMMSLTASMRPQWKLLFWIAWWINALVCAALVLPGLFLKAFH